MRSIDSRLGVVHLGNRFARKRYSRQNSLAGLPDCVIKPHAGPRITQFLSKHPQEVSLKVDQCSTGGPRVIRHGIDNVDRTLINGLEVPRRASKRVLAMTTPFCTLAISRPVAMPNRLLSASTRCPTWASRAWLDRNTRSAVAWFPEPQSPNSDRYL